MEEVYDKEAEDNEQLLEEKLIQMLEKLPDEDVNDEEDEQKEEDFPLWWRTIVHPILLKHPTICSGCFKERASDFSKNMSLCPVCLGLATRCSKCDTPFMNERGLKDKCRPCKEQDFQTMAREWKLTRQFPCPVCEGNGRIRCICCREKKK